MLHRETLKLKIKKKNKNIWLADPFYTKEIFFLVFS